MEGYQQIHENITLERKNILPAFLALYTGLQIGLPDSFRTGGNSTDDCACTLLLNEICEHRFLDRGVGYHESS